MRKSTECNAEAECNDEKQSFHTGPNQCTPGTTVGEASDIGTEDGWESTGAGGTYEVTTHFNMSSTTWSSNDETVFSQPPPTEPFPPPYVQQFNARTDSDYWVTAIAWSGIPGQSNIVFNQPLTVHVYAVGYGHDGFHYSWVPIPKVDNLYSPGTNMYNCNTGDDGHRCRIRLKLNKVSMAVGIRVEDRGTGRNFYGAWINVSPFGGPGLPRRMEDYGCQITSSGCIHAWFALIGGYPDKPNLAHLYNHFCYQVACDALLNISYWYVTTYGLLFPINDISLVRGGIFDLDARWTTRSGHQRHQTGMDTDIRTNCDTYSIPCPESHPIRAVLAEKIQYYTGRWPAYHGAIGSANRHIHIYH